MKRKSEGVSCPICGDMITHCVDSRYTAKGNYTRRRRVCQNGHRFTTQEKCEIPGPREDTVDNACMWVNKTPVNEFSPIQYCDIPVFLP